MPDTPPTTAAKLSTQAWIDAARTTLIREGIHAVKIDRLARDCGVTRGGFYWRFRSHAELLAALLADWRETNTAPMLTALEGPDDPDTRFVRLARLWVEELGFSPAYDAAVREWARGDASVREVVHNVDEQRIGALCRLFLDYGYDADEALVRARITYYHQVGYYALNAQRDDVRRAELTPLYIRALTGPRGGISPGAG